jgi:hypothetical protein
MQLVGIEPYVWKPVSLILVIRVKGELARIKDVAVEISKAPPYDRPRVGNGRRVTLDSLAHRASDRFHRGEALAPTNRETTKLPISFNDVGRSGRNDDRKLAACVWCWIHNQFGDDTGDRIYPTGERISILRAGFLVRKLASVCANKLPCAAADRAVWERNEDVAAYSFGCDVQHRGSEEREALRGCLYRGELVKHAATNER